MDPISSAIAAVSVLLFLVIAVSHTVNRRRRMSRDAVVLQEKLEKNLHIPRSLHPIIDTEICIGSLSCLKACPEGDILGIQKGTAVLVHADHCIGHGRCAAECPVSAIKLVMGTLERGVDLPEVDESFESSRPGVYVVGELGGMGLLRNAIRQGLHAVKRIDEILPKGGAGAGAVDVVIVGAGAAGLATACALQEAGRSYRLLEQGTWGGTMYHYPRRKIVMTEPATIPGFGKIGKNVISKEELLETWAKALEKTQVKVDEGIQVKGIDGQDGAFAVHTSKGIIHRASCPSPVVRRKARGSRIQKGIAARARTKPRLRWRWS